MRAATTLVLGILALAARAVPAAAADAPPAPAPQGAAAAPAAAEPAPAWSPPWALPAAPAAATAAAPAARPEPAAARRHEAPGLGVLLRGGYFGLPDAIADSLFRMHPKVEGWIYGAEFRYHGDGGGRGVGSVGIAVDRARTEAEGLWQSDEFDEPWAASGEIEMTAVTVTGYVNILPSWFLHPYVGFGLGAAYLQGSYRKDDDIVNVDAWFPAVHVPAGLALELGDRFFAAAEVRFIDGIAAGGAFQVRF